RILRTYYFLFQTYPWSYTPVRAVRSCDGLGEQIRRTGLALTMLKLYQLNPDKYDESTVRTILLKTLTVLPGADFALAKCLIDEDDINSTELQLVCALAPVLQSFDFAVFWRLAKREYPADNKFKAPAEIANFINSIPRLEETVRV
ncbi:hypothetical protein PENTCL1PPCAC_4034, partial [Pristionchus entomophagus]